MTNIKIVDTAFEHWVSQNLPLFEHPNDQERFFSFVKTFLEEGDRRWEDPDFFFDSIKQHRSQATDDEIRELWNLIPMIKLVIAAPIYRG